ncbi:zinc-dependent peptidase [Desulfurivibrio sp. D14AmB]|uniref:M90 family metallopeptidase n=1 Tax=Desulfurivibrio sp. D14AmB TaxID=3374370 RepID=UPI00376F0B69
MGKRARVRRERLMWRWFKNWRRQRLLRRAALPDSLWSRALVHPKELFAGLDERQRQRLRELATLFLARKEFYGAHGFQITPFMRVAIAAQACVPILNLGLESYAGWTSMVIYRDSFVAPREETDEDGIVHSGQEVLAGESWAGGPVVLSWADCAPGAYPHGPAGNVIIHEFAHKLDMGSGTVNGTPPLPRDMDGGEWDEVMEQAYQGLRADLDDGVEPPLDPYAAQDPGEFFAVCSEYFFMAPSHLRRILPEVYRQLTLYYRRDPAGFRAFPRPDRGPDRS